MACRDFNINPRFVVSCKELQHKLSRVVWFSIVLCGLSNSSLFAFTIKPQPDPGLEASVRAADLIVDLDILAGGPFSAVARIRTVFKGKAKGLISLEGYNSLNGNTVHAGFPTGSRYILFLSKTDRKDTYASLTPTAPRLRVDDGEVLLTLGKPSFRIPIKTEMMIEALQLMVDAVQAGKASANAEKVIRGIWARDQIEARYLAVALIGFIRDERVLSLAIEASGHQLLRLRLTAIEALQKIPTKASLETLQRLIVDSRSTVARAAVSALISLGHIQSIEAILLWAQKVARRQARYKTDDIRRAKIQTVMAKLRNWIELRGSLLERNRVCPGLMELARCPDPTMARDAVYLLGLLSGKTQIPKLLALAEDPVFQHVEEAKIALFRATLRNADDLDAFRKWWDIAEDGFGEDLKRKVAEAAAQGLSRETDTEEKAQLLGTLYGAPGGIALVSLAPLLLREDMAYEFDTYDLLRWNTPLALPFLLERLGSPSSRTRRGAIFGLSYLANKHPRLRSLIHPYIRAALSDEDGGVRRTAASTAGVFEDTQVLPTLFDALRYSGVYEANDVARAIYSLTGRTMGYGANEPSQDLEAAARRLQGWWKGVPADAKVSWRSPLTTFPKLPVTNFLPIRDIEKQCIGTNSRSAESAFAVLMEAKPATDPYWKKLLKARRVRDRAHGLTGLVGLQENAPEVMTSLVSLFDAQNPGAALLRAGAAVTLASLQGASEKGEGIKGTTHPGAAWLAVWMASEGVRAELPLRRLVTVAFALADGEAKSLKFLTHCIQTGTLAELIEEDTTEEERLVREQLISLQWAALMALCARTDGTDALMVALSSETSEVREMALRELAARRHYEAVEGMLRVLERASTYTLSDLVRKTAPLIKAKDVKRLETMMSSVDDAARISAAWLLSLRWELITESDTHSALMAGARDFSDVVRMRCGEALGKLNLKEALPVLVSMLRAVDSGVKAAAAEAVASIGDADACAVAAEEAKTLYRLDARWVRALAIHGGDEQLALILKFTKSNRWIDQRVGIDALGVCRRPEALTRLLEIYHDDEAAFQSHAAEALALQGDLAVTALEKDLGGADAGLRVRAVHTLSRIKTMRSGMLLIQLLKEEKMADLANFALRRIFNGFDVGYTAKASAAEREAFAEKWKILIVPKALRRSGTSSSR